MESSSGKSIFYEELETATVDLIENNFDDLNKTLTKCSNRFGKDGKQKLLYNELLMKLFRKSRYFRALIWEISKKVIHNGPIYEIMV